MRSELFKDIIWNTGAQAIVKLRGFIVIPIISYFCGLQWYGAWVITYMIASYGGIIGSMMISNALVRFYPEETDKRDIFCFVLSIVVAAAAVLVTVELIVSKWITLTFLKEHMFGDLVLWGSFLILVEATKQMLENYLRAIGELKKFSAVQALFPVVEVCALSVTLILTGDLVKALKVFLAAAFTIEIVMIIRITRGAYMKNVFNRKNWQTLARYLKYSLPLVPGAITVLIASNGDKLVVGYLLDSRSIGVYSLAYAVASSVMLFNVPIVNSLFPKVSALFKDRELGAISSYISKGMYAFAAVCVAAMVVTALFGQEILSFLGKYDASGGDAGIAMIVIFSLMVYGLSRIFALHLYVHNRTWTLSLIYMYAAITNIVLNLVLIKHLGILGAAIATLASYSLMALITYLKTTNQVTKVALNG